MVYQTTITQKGQITIPKAIREALHLYQEHKVLLEFKPRDQQLVIRPQYDFVARAQKTKVREKASPAQERSCFEKNYERA